MKKGQFFRNVIICLAIAMTLSPAHAGSDKAKNAKDSQVRKVAVVVEQKRGFELIYNQATTAYGTASLLGAVGWDGEAIAHGIDKGKDKKKSASMTETVADVCCSSIFIKSLSPLTEQNSLDRVYILPDANQKTNLSDCDATATFTINRWGLRLVEREANNVSAFVEVEAKMVTNKNKKTIWEKRDVILGSRHEKP